MGQDAQKDVALFGNKICLWKHSQYYERLLPGCKEMLQRKKAQY